jgi:hypothetical protein
MPGGDCCDLPSDDGCGDATQPETVAPDAPETCADVGVDNNCNGDEQEVDGLGDVCEATICPGAPACRCRFGTLECEAGALFCRAQFSPETEECNNRDDNCNGVGDASDPAAHHACAVENDDPSSYCATDTCVMGCQTTQQCTSGGLGDRCQIEPGESFGRCVCGDGPACGDNERCAPDAHFDPPQYVCLCGGNLCGPGEGCSVAGECTCGEDTPSTIGATEACPDDSNHPYCNTAPEPPRCDCFGVVCLTDQACCGPGDRCVDTQSDADHCGDCDTQCSSDERCSQGVCTQAEEFP